MGSSQKTTHTAYNQLVKSNWQNNERLILVIVPEEIILGRIIRPDVLDALINIAFVFYLLQILQNLQRRT